jgi:NNP family nitrate/nitrite transporter-like MFS transporter
MTERTQASAVLTLNTLAFTVCFACWMMNGVLVTFLVDNGIYSWDKAQIGWLIGIPVLTGSIVRLPLGVLTDKYGGRIVFGVLMLLSAVPMYLMSFADSYSDFLWGSLGFGLAGGSFSVGIAYTSVWFPKERQGTALGIFGMGNAGSAITSLLAPTLLKSLTAGGSEIENWRSLPRIYAASLVVMTVIFLLLTHSRKTTAAAKTIGQQLAPLKSIRVWRFGLYYFLVFGGFVALAQWLIPYYVNVYTMSIAMAGLMASIFSLPSGVIRALGGWMSDRFGARRVMYWVLGSCLISSALLVVPRMDIYSPGGGVMALAGGTVSDVSPTQVSVTGTTGAVRTYPMKVKPETSEGEGFGRSDSLLIWPTARSWQEPAVKAGDAVKKKQLLARGVTHLYFQANVWIFTFLVFVLGIMMGIGKAAVYKHIPDYFPQEVGVVGGIVGVLGGLGGFFCPILFGYLLNATGIWTTCWMFLAALSLVCLVWMHRVIQRMMKEKVPDLMSQMENAGARA